MAVIIVTDGTADLPACFIDELGIVEVPVYLVFSDKSFRSRIEISNDEFYQRLFTSPTLPTTSQPTPQDFAEVYARLAPQAEGIISIHVSDRLSGTINSALQGKRMVNASCPIEIIDSKGVSMALGLIVIEAARMAKAGKSFQEIVDAVNKMVPTMRLLVLFDTLEYLARGGRIGKAKSMLGSLLKVKPLLTLKGGEFHPVGQARNRSKGKAKLLEFVASAENIEELTVVYSTTPDEARELAEQITSVPASCIILAQLGAVLGTHSGPGMLAVALRTRS
jgi:DegV family protein with EDD domain